MSDDLYDADYPLTDYNKRTELAKRGKFVLTEDEVAFDAADVMRFGKDIFVQISQVTNWGGYEWLRRHLSPTYRVHPINIADPNAFHLDTALLPLRPGLLLANPHRPCYQMEFFKNNGWDVIHAPEPMQHSGLPSIYTSTWMSMNVLSLDEERVIIQSKEKDLAELLQKYGFKTIGVDLTNSFNIGGGLSCWVLDVRRKGELQSYFNKF